MRRLLSVDRINRYYVQNLPDPSGGTLPIIGPGLLGVSCPAANFCVAVGAFTVGAVGITIADSWNGKVWKKLSFPVPLGSTTAFLTQVSCPSATGQFEYTNETPRRALAEVWNGKSWSLRSALDSLDTGSSLEGVSCAAGTSCVAVGQAPDVGGVVSAFIATGS